MERTDQLRALLVELSSAADPAARLTALVRLRRELDAVETELAADALRIGLSWSQIGEALGISKQAAHRRHSHGVARLDQAAEAEHRGTRMIVSSEARSAVRLARREAAAAGSPAAGTEHLLLGLLQCGDCEVTPLLQRLGVTLERARAAIEPTIELSPQDAVRVRGDADPDEARGPSAAVSPLARRVLEHALRDASDRAQEPLSALDLLRALLQDDHGGAARTLAALGVEPAAVLTEIGRVSGRPLSRHP